MPLKVIYAYVAEYTPLSVLIEKMHPRTYELSPSEMEGMLGMVWH